MTQSTPNFEFIVTVRPKGMPEDVFTMKVQAKDVQDAKRLALEEHKGFEVLATDCPLPRWRREFGHAIISEKEVFVGKREGWAGTRCLEVETEFAVVLVGPQDVYGSVSKTEREAMYWGIYGGKKHGRLRGEAAMWFMTQQHRVGRKGGVKPDARSTRQTCGAEIYRHAATGVTSKMLTDQQIAERRAKEEAARLVLQPRIDAGEFEPKNFDSYHDAMMAFDNAKSKLGLYNAPFFMRLYPKVEAA